MRGELSKGGFCTGKVFVANASYEILIDGRDSIFIGIGGRGLPRICTHPPQSTLKIHQANPRREVAVQSPESA